MEIEEINALTEQIIGAAIAVHESLGPGLLESIYTLCLHHELRNRHLRFHAQVPVAIQHGTLWIPNGLRLDLVVADAVIVELKAVEKLLPVHQAQLRSYLRLTGKRVGLLINFNVPYLKQGIRRVINGY